MTEKLKNMMCILGPEGDTKITWDPVSENEIEVARKEFDDYMTKNYSAYTVDNNGKKGVKLTSFNPFVGKIILVPPVTGG